MASDFAGNTTVYIDAFTIKKDTTVPQVQVAFDTNTVTWINSSQLYNINFYSQGPSNLDSIQYAVTTALTATALPSSLDKYSNSSAKRSFIHNPAHVSFFSACERRHKTMCLRAWNITGTTATVTDAFRIFKDVTNPTISDPMYGGDTVWRSTPAAGGITSTF